MNMACLKDKKWIVGVSGGSDSMALLHMCQTSGLDIVVAHVNYQKRKSATRDQHIIEKYCQSHHILYEVYLVPLHEEKGNFQANARKQRYLFYARLLKKYQADGVLLAHHKDDVLETYFMQEQRNSIPDFFGICETAIIEHCLIKRPLLHKTKKELLQYCEVNKVPYGHDETNDSNIYTRNKIRHDIVDHLTDSKKDQYIMEIDKKNEYLEIKRKNIYKFLDKWKGEVDLLKKELDIEDIIFYYIKKEIGITLSMKHIQEIKHHVVSEKASWKRPLSNNYIVYGTLQKLHIEKMEDYDFEYVLEQLDYVSHTRFTLCDQGMKIQSLTLYPSDFPITIRSPKKGDKIKMRFGTKLLARWFVDRKIPEYERKRWFVIENVNKEIIFIPKIGCNHSHFSNNPTIFVIE